MKRQKPSRPAKSSKNRVQSERLPLWTEAEFHQRMRQVGEESYYDKHPFHLLLQEGKLSRDAIKCWIRNRFYYQRNIPVKDAHILANAPRFVRKIWLHRITDHDGGDASGQPGGILSWVRLDLGVSAEGPRDFAAKSSEEQTRILLAHEEKLNTAPVLPGVQSAVGDYVEFARTARWELAVASSLTEMFAPDLMTRRLAGLEQNYPGIPSWSYDYFRNRPPQARRDCGEAWALVVKHCATPQLQRQAVDALKFKCRVLWSLLDSILAACRKK
jgi:pyrroloquinoline-quinone synthase